MLRLEPLLEVLSCERSIAFFGALGFDVASSSEENGHIVWALLVNGGASLMIGRYDKLEPGKGQHAIIYLYVADLHAFHSSLVASGVDVKPIEYPAYLPAGEISMCDENGYLIRIAREPR